MMLLALLAPPANAHEALPAWLTGDWCAELNGAVVEEHWLAPVGAMMLGVGRTIVDGETGDFEFLRIVADADGLALLAQPRGRSATRFAATLIDASSIHFTNPAHDFPTSITYRRVQDRLTAIVSGDDAGKAIRIDYLTCDAGASG